MVSSAPSFRKVLAGEVPATIGRGEVVVEGCAGDAEGDKSRTHSAERGYSGNAGEVECEGYAVKGGGSDGDPGA